jgi:ABC-type nitrate/sulfonate/bicarbonate transport system substrate-binding protein
VKFFIFLALLFSSLDAGNIHKVSLQMDWKYQFQFAGFIAAKEKGFYRDAGLDVELREYQPSIDIVSDVLTQKATYGTYNSSIVVENSQIKPLVLLATYFQQSPLIFVAKKGIKHPSDMIGKTIMGTKDELKYSNLALLLNHFDISSKNAHFVDHTFCVDDFIKGKVDVMSAFRSNQLYLLDKAGVKYEIIDPSDYGFVMSAVNLFTSPKESLEHSEETENIYLSFVYEVVV